LKLTVRVRALPSPARWSNARTWGTRRQSGPGRRQQLERWSRHLSSQFRILSRVELYRPCEFVVLLPPPTVALEVGLLQDKARTAPAVRDGTAFIAVAPKKRPGSAHSPRTGLTHDDQFGSSFRQLAHGGAGKLRPLSLITDQATPAPLARSVLSSEHPKPQPLGLHTRAPDAEAVLIDWPLERRVGADC
jgi:hypothetical protein